MVHCHFYSDANSSRHQRSMGPLSKDVVVGVGLGVADLAFLTVDCLETSPGHEAEVVGQSLM
jgi:hypothetical protein